MSFLGPETIRTLSMPYKFTDSLLYDPVRIKILKDAIAADTLKPRIKTKWNAVVATPATHTVLGNIDPWYVPRHYGDDGPIADEIVANVNSDTSTCASYAYRYAVLGDEADATRVANILAAYSNIQVFDPTGDSSLVFARSWTLFIQSAMMISGSPAYTATIDTNFKACLTRALTQLEAIAYTRDNNWAASGIGMEIIAGVYLKDRKRFDAALNQWKVIFDYSVVSNFVVNNGGPAQNQTKNNVAWQEVYRNGADFESNGSDGFTYSAGHLNSMTIAAEYARLNGEWLYDHVTPDGSSLKGFWEEISYITRYGAPWLSYDYLKVQWFNTSNKDDPSSASYWKGYSVNRIQAAFYILQGLWPNQNAQEIMYGGFNTLAVPAGTFPPIPGGQASYLHTGLSIAQDYYGLAGADLAHSDRPLYG